MSGCQPEMARVRVPDSAYLPRLNRRACQDVECAWVFMVAEKDGLSRGLEK